MNDKDSELGLESQEFDSTRVITRSLELDGITFSWWAVDDSPSLVTVSSRWFGRKSEFTDSDIEAMAVRLAKSILEDQREKAAEVRETLQQRADRRTVS